MKKQLLLVCIIISTFLSLFLFNSCKNKADQEGNETQDSTNIVVKIGDDYLKPSDDDDLIVFLYLNIIDTKDDYDKFDYYFIHNDSPDKKLKINSPTVTDDDGTQDLEPTFVSLNFGPRNKLPIGDEDFVKYNFKIKRIDKKDASIFEPLDDKYKGDWTYKKLLAIDSKVVIQSIRIKFNDPTYPGSITPPIKPIDSP